MQNLIVIKQGDEITEITTKNYMIISDNGVGGVTVNAQSTIPWINEVMKYELFCKIRDGHITDLLEQEKKLLSQDLPKATETTATAQ